MKKARVAALCAGTMILTGCMPAYVAPPQPLWRTPLATFEQAPLAAGIMPGHATIRGQAFSKTVGGDIKYGAGNDINLVPDTPYSRECIDILSSSPSECAAKVRPYVRTVQADGEGRFEFTGIAPGSYIVTTTITWGIPTGYGIRQTGGQVTAIANVANDTDEVTVNVH